MATKSSKGEFPQLLTPAEAASILRVTPTSLARWAEAGRLACIRLPGGHRRYTSESVSALASGEVQDGVRYDRSPFNGRLQRLTRVDGQA